MMKLINISFITLLSLVLGSFLNVCIYRIPRGESIIFPPSHCPVCKTKIKPYDLIPVLSFIILKGRCRACHEKIPVRYPIVEILSLLCAIGAYSKFGFSVRTWIAYFIGFMLIYISFVDIDTFEISNLSILILFVLLSLFYFSDKGFSLINLKRLILGGIYSSLFVLIIYLFSRGKAMGFGDVLLLFAGGVGFDLGKALVANFLSFVTGALYSILLLLLRRKPLKTQLPFAPFIAMSIYLTLLLGDEIVRWYLGLFSERL